LLEVGFRGRRKLLAVGLACALAAVAALPPADAGSVSSASSVGKPAGGGPPSRLGRAARRAAALLRQDQQPEGYWLTSYTPAPRFADPRREMNVFSTAMIVDVLGPAAARAGLGGCRKRARRHLAGQVEASGLVRYHGRPGGLAVPALGCVITPDADDTALVWRIAKGSRGSRLSRALATLRQYRTADGLYRTWLAPRERYECIDPGSDPNPADAGIQMHVFLLLAGADPAAARALCDALTRAVSEDRIWVYYRTAPLVPLLRQADLRRAGCPLQLPETRLGPPVAGQEPWLEAGRLLAERLAPGVGGAAGWPRDAALELLRNLAQDDFAAVRSNPPLLYHNDVTAGTPRFYWSADFGYALWLRLYLESTRAVAARPGGHG
jgi:hypothetical protein